MGLVLQLWAEGAAHNVEDCISRLTTLTEAFRWTDDSEI